MWRTLKPKDVDVITMGRQCNLSRFLILASLRSDNGSVVSNEVKNRREMLASELSATPTLERSLAVLERVWGEESPDKELQDLAIRKIASFFLKTA